MLLESLAEGGILLGNSKYFARGGVFQPLLLCPVEGDLPAINLREFDGDVITHNLTLSSGRIEITDFANSVMIRSIGRSNVHRYLPVLIESDLDTG